jgi:predicted lipoprotein with Yx(FWY)xxD motif
MLAGAAAAVTLIAGCGSSNSSGTTATTSAAATTAAATSSTQTTAAASSANGVLIVSKHTKAGTALAAGPKKLTVYLFEKDTGPASTCAGGCAAAWPPVTTSGAPTGSGDAQSADLGTIKRADGTTQVTYKGHPLYFFVKDKDDGDSYGQGVHAFGADWYMVAPSGSKIDSGEQSGGGGSS